MNRLLQRTHVNLLTDCWEWQGAKTKQGYGQVGYQGKVVYTHRLMHRLLVGEWAEDCVLHRCDNPSCLNPSHLFLGTRADNNKDRKRKGRSSYPAGDSNGGSKLTGLQVKKMRILYREGWSQKYLCDRFDMSKAQVSKIINRRSWVNV